MLLRMSSMTRRHPVDDGRGRAERGGRNEYYANHDRFRGTTVYPKVITTWFGVVLGYCGCCCCSSSTKTKPYSSSDSSPISSTHEHVRRTPQRVSRLWLWRFLRSGRGATHRPSHRMISRSDYGLVVYLLRSTNGSSSWSSIVCRRPYPSPSFPTPA